jgi:hypothetical protein
MQMSSFHNVTALPIITHITLFAVVVMFGGFLAVVAIADNPQYVIVNSETKTKIKHPSENDPRSQSHNHNSQLIQVAMAQQQQPTKPLYIKIKNITADNPTDDNISTISIAFDIRNPNQNTILLEGLNYNMYSGNIRIITGSIGSQLISDIFQSQSEYPIIGNGFLVLKDKQNFEKDSEAGGNSESFNNILKGNAHYVINGTIYYKQISNIQSYGGTQQFEGTFP